MGNIFDLIFIIIIIVSVIDGYRQGFLKTLLGVIISVVAPIIAYILTSRLWNKLSDVVAPMAVNKTEFLTAFVSFIIILIVIGLTARILLETAGFFNKIPVVGVLNKILGMVIGLAGAIVLILILWLLYVTFGLYTGQIESGELIATDYSVVLAFIFDPI
jgi:uncharacterized membrane protein required for colicin V production